MKHWILIGALAGAGSTSWAQTPAVSPEKALVNQYCVTCHNARAKTGNLALDGLDPLHPGENAETWEKAVRKLTAGMMPPAGAPRPDRATLDRFTAKLEAGLDTWA